jgi:hypothetical protein
MSKDIIKKRGSKVLERSQCFLMEFVITPKQRLFLEIDLGARVSPVWDGRVLGVKSAQRRLHDILDAVNDRKTEYHHGGLTTAELFKLATTIGIDRDKAETNKKLLWQQISRRLSFELSRAEAQAILYALLKTLTEDEIRWLKEWRSVSWKGYFLGSKKWIAGRATTLTECSINIEDILRAMTGETEFNGYRAGRPTRNLSAIAKNLAKRSCKGKNAFKNNGKKEKNASQRQGAFCKHNGDSAQLGKIYSIRIKFEIAVR